MSAVAGASERLRLRDWQRAVSSLPMAHIAELLGIAELLCIHCFAIAHGWQVTTCSDPRAITSLLPQVRPGGDRKRARLSRRRRVRDRRGQALDRQRYSRRRDRRVGAGRETEEVAGFLVERGSPGLTATVIEHTGSVRSVWNTDIELEAPMSTRAEDVSGVPAAPPVRSAARRNPFGASVLTLYAVAAIGDALVRPELV